MGREVGLDRGLRVLLTEYDRGVSFVLSLVSEGSVLVGRSPFGGRPTPLDQVDLFPSYTVCDVVDTGLVQDV